MRTLTGRLLGEDFHTRAFSRADRMVDHADPSASGRKRIVYLSICVLVTRNRSRSILQERDRPLFLHSVAVSFSS